MAFCSTTYDSSDVGEGQAPNGYGDYFHGVGAAGRLQVGAENLKKATDNANTRTMLYIFDSLFA